MGRLARAEQAVTALVAVAVLCDYRLGDRLLDCLSRLAAIVFLHQRRVQVAFACRGQDRSRGAPAATQSDDHATCYKIAAGNRIDSCLARFCACAWGRAFADNCAPCHGAGGGGAKGYPNLVDNDWLWGGTLNDISQTITHGVRAGDDKGHQGSMPAFGRDGMLKREDILVVADYVRSLSGLSTNPGADLARGAKIFADNCAPCHGPEGKGNRSVGAPNLTDQIWLYGSDTNRKST